MRYRRLGRTGLRVSLLGLGTGGPSQFGQATGVEETTVVRMLKRALDLGVNFIDSSAQYGDSESMLGKILAKIPRSDFIISTKFASVLDGRVPSAPEVIESVEKSLKRLRIDVIDLLQFHGVIPSYYDTVMDVQLEAAVRLVEQGKCRFLGLSENYTQDHFHIAVSRALSDKHFDAFMIAYSILSPSAESVVLDDCRKNNVGVIDMVAVRRGLSRPEHLCERLKDAMQRGVIDSGSVDLVDPLGWLLEEGVSSLPAAGYKFAAAHPAVSTVLTGTADITHLEENVAAVNSPQLSMEAMSRIRHIFGGVRENLGD